MLCREQEQKQGFDLPKYPSLARLKFCLGFAFLIIQHKNRRVVSQETSARQSAEISRS